MARSAVTRWRNYEEAHCSTGAFSQLSERRRTCRYLPAECLFLFGKLFELFRYFPDLFVALVEQESISQRDRFAFG